MGVAGVALATFIAQGLSSVLSLFYLSRRLKKIQVQESPLYFDKTILALFCLC